ncbi:MAG: tetratricopeptide repeat protein [Muribaculaceae bacterium]|nr:tetratricopeptide repeat protein [Muribaculaceae bacterium]
MIKNILKIIVGLVVGGLIGLLIGGLIVVVFTDTTWSEYIDKYYSIDISEGILVFLVAVASMIVSFMILVPIHELGHLVCGLLTGYKFVSFRVFNYTILKENGRFKIKKFGVAGTGGQCLLTPPELPLEQIPTGWYNFGGVLANIIMLLIALPFFFLDLNPFVAEALGIFIATDAIMILLNGIPMQAGGVGNDGYNIKLLKKNFLSKKGIINQLRANALIQNGVRPKDMPEDLFINPEEIDYHNALEVSIPLMFSSRLIDRKEHKEALEIIENLYSHKDEIMPLYVKEIACELAFLYMRTGNPDKAEAILDKDLMKYIETYRKMMSSKERLICAIALYLEKDESKARQIYENIKARQEEYLLQGEVKSDIALMEDMLN